VPAPRGTFTRIIYFADALTILTAPRYFLVPNNVLTEGMHAALTMAHQCEFGVGVGTTGENEAELKMGAIMMVDVDVSPKYKLVSQKQARPVAERGALVQYLQKGAPEICVAQTTITHEYIFKNVV
jgi:hypothetical protein